MGMCCSKATARGLEEEHDLAFEVAFPEGKKPSERVPSKQLDEEGDNDSESIASSSSEELFPSDEEEGVEASHRSTVKRTHRLRVGVLEGTTFLNNYIVIDTLGRGSYAKVKLCLNIADDALYAVKVVDKKQVKQVAKSRQLQGRVGHMASADATPSSGGNSGLADLRREVDVMRALDHPNLVKLYEVIDDRESGKLLMVVEYCECGALVKPGQLAPDRRMPEAIAQYYFRQMAAGMAYLHAHSVVHGDVKPENVLLSGDGTVKIADFGQSQFMQHGQDTFRRTLGTPSFLSPEICAGADYKGRPADVWALGVSLYYFIYGELPFRGDTLLELYESIEAAKVPFPEDVPVSMGLQDILVRALCPDPSARITAEEMSRHPWVQDEDLLTLMPSFFADEAAASRAGSGGEGGAASLRSASLGSTAPLGSSPTGSSPSARSPMGRGGAAPAAADVAAAVFPTLLGSMGGALHRSFSLLGPDQSIVGALLQANSHSLSRNKLAAHPSNRLHMLARDSMVKSSLPETDAAGGAGSAEGGGGGRRTGGGSGNSRQSGGSQEGVASPGGRSGGRSGGSDGGRSSSRSVLAGDSASSLQSSGGVDRSAPSAFTLLVEQAVQAQSEIVQRQQEQRGRAVLRGPSGLHTIQEVGSAELDSTAPASTAASALPGDSFTLSRDGSGDSSAAAVSPHGAAVRWLSMSSTASGELPSPFGGSSPFASPNDSMQLPGAPPGAGTAPGGHPPSLPMPIPTTSGPGAAQRGTGEERPETMLHPPGSRPMDLSHSIISPFASSSGAFASGPFTSGSNFSTASLPENAEPVAAAATPAPPAGTFPPAKPGQALQVGAAGTSSAAEAGGVDEQAADGSKKPRLGLLHRLSFKRKATDSEPQQPAPLQQQSSTTPIQYHSFKAGQKLAFFTGSVRAPALYYIESGVVELQWEAALPVALSTVFSTALQKLPGQAVGGSPMNSAAAYLTTADSYAESAPQAQNLANFLAMQQAAAAASGGGKAAPPGEEGLLLPADSMAVTLQQATQRAETLMTNAMGGSVDNLLVAQRTATQYVGALSMMDPNFFANRWRAAAVARTDVVVVRLTREGLDQFLAENPLAQVHLRASMARGRAEIIKLEALERVADAHRRKRFTPPPAKESAWRTPWVPLGDAAEAAAAAAAEAAAGAAGAVKGAAGSAVDTVTQAGAAAHTATLDMFALVSRLRAAAGEAFTPVPGGDAA